MNIKFPSIQNISQVRDLIASKQEFIIAEREWYSVVNYLVAMPDSFIGSNDEETALLRECRGLIFCNKSGRVISRPYHKFFNLNEKEETQKHNVNWNNQFSVLEKLDGSMIRAIAIPGTNGEFRLGTKMGITDIALHAERFVASRKEYMQFIKQAVQLDITPIFEWCSNKHQIVVSHSEDKLVLTALRDNYTGTYLNIYQDDWAVDVVERYPFTEIDLLVDHCKSLENAEGYVIRFHDGHMLKVKGDWYLQLHKSKDRIRFEKDVIDLILSDTIDDIKPFLLEFDLKKIEKFEKEFNEGILNSAAKMGQFVTNHKGLTRKEFAAVLNASSKIFLKANAIMWKIYDGKDPLQAIKDMVGRNTSSQTAVESVRFLFNAKFKGD
jgi:T4 RnlA family RNA ligase